MKASIIIPVYNQAEYLKEAISSALNQTYNDFEVIVVNDGSLDNSYDVAKSFGVKVINQSNKGLSGARNAGVMNSSGEALLMLDADDWIEKNYLEKTIPLLTEEVGAVSINTATFGDNGDGVWEAAGQVELAVLKEQNCLPYCSLISRAAFLETGGYNPRMTWGYEDWNLWIDIVKRGWKVVSLRELLFHYRIKKVSMFTEALKHHAELVAQIHVLHPDLFGGK